MDYATNVLLKIMTFDQLEKASDDLTDAMEFVDGQDLRDLVNAVEEVKSEMYYRHQLKPSPQEEGK
jgi:hypothetical protein